MQDGPGSGVLAAIAIVLLWLAGVAFFVAFEGASVLGTPVALADGTGTNWFASVLAWLGKRAGAMEKAGGQGQ